jgi:hypothetical protein
MYLPAEDFDPLSRLFLEVLRHERSIKRLVSAFGLTERVVEDVLGDLIRRNRVALVIKDDVKELRLIDDAIPNLVREAGEALDVWQDQATGVVLPAWLIDKFDQQRFESGLASAAVQIAVSSGPPLIEDFTNAPDAQLIEMLIRSDVELREREEFYGILDRLVDRFRVRPQTILIPIIEAKFQEYRIPQIVSDDLPGWVARIWSVTLRKQQLQPSDYEAGIYAAAAIVTSGAAASQIMDGWRAAARLEAWLSAVHRFLRLVPAPLSGYELREVREHQAALRSLFLSVGRVELVITEASSSDETWFDTAFDESRDWIVLVLPWGGQIDSLIKCVRKRSDGRLSLPNTLVVVVPTATTTAYEETLNKLMGSGRFSTIIQRPWPALGPSIVLCDTPRVRARYSPGSALMQFAGERLASEWLTVVQALPMRRDDPASKEVSNLLRGLRIRRATVPDSDSARLGAGPDAPTISSALNELRAFGDILLTAIVDPELVMRELAGNVATSVQGGHFDKYQSLVQQLPALLERVDVLSHHFSLAPSPPWAVWTRLNAYELAQAMITVLTEPSRRSVEGQISILSRGVGTEALSPSFIDLIEGAVVKHGWTIEIGFAVSRTPPSSDQLASACLSIRARISAPRLRFFALNQPVPAHALVVGDVVFIASVDWLQSVLQQNLDPVNFGFAIESRDLAESFRSCFVGCQQIWSTGTGSV